MKNKNKAPRASRYDQINLVVAHLSPATIIEIGTWNGKRATKLLSAAMQKASKVHYTGYDLFEHATAAIDAEELNVKHHIATRFAAGRIQASIDFNNWQDKVTFNLIAGNTRETLKPGTKADFVFIDGGHSVETIENDYFALEQSSVIILDDYYVANQFGSIKDITKYGCNQLIDKIRSNPELTITTLPAINRISGGGNVQLMLISRVGPIWPINQTD